MGLFRDNHFHSHHTTTVAPAYPQEVNHHHAPTDETVKLMREMEEAAQKRVIHSYHYSENNVNGVVVHMKLSANSFEEVLLVHFTLNGNDHIITVPMTTQMQAIKSISSRRVEFSEILYKYVIEAVAHELIPGITEKLYKK